MPRRELDGREEYDEKIICGGTRAMTQVCAAHVMRSFLLDQNDELKWGISKKIRAYNRFTPENPSIKDIIAQRLQDQGTEWEGLEGTLHFDPLLLPERSPRQWPHRIGLTVFSVLDGGQVHPDAFETEIGYRLPNLTTVHDVLPRGTDIPRQLAYTVHGALNWRDAAVALQWSALRA